MGGGRGEFGIHGGTDRQTCVLHGPGRKGCSLAEGAEGGREGWRAEELLEAGFTESLLTSHFYSKVSVSRPTLFCSSVLHTHIHIQNAHTHPCPSRFEA